MTGPIPKSCQFADSVLSSQDRTWNAATRPAIESHMGYYSDFASLPGSAAVSQPSSAKTSRSSSETDALSRTLTNDSLAHHISRQRDSGCHEPMMGDVDVLTVSSDCQVIPDYGPRDDCLWTGVSDRVVSSWLESVDSMQIQFLIFPLFSSPTPPAWSN